MVRQWKKWKSVVIMRDEFQTPSELRRDTYQYSFAGPLSMSKGCDKAFEPDTVDTSKDEEYIYRGSNVAVATDASCFMDWIADEYNMKLEYEYEEKKSCHTPSGDRNDIDRSDIPCW